jgi:hypothetical protein
MALPSPAQAGLRCIIIGGMHGAGAEVGNQGGGTISTRIVNHDHGSFTGFMFVAGTLTAEPAGLHAAARRVCWPIRGSGHDLLQVAATRFSAPDVDGWHEVLSQGFGGRDGARTTRPVNPRPSTCILVELHGTGHTTTGCTYCPLEC